MLSVQDCGSLQRTAVLPGDRRAETLGTVSLSELHAFCQGLWQFTEDGLLVWREEGRNFRNCLTLMSFMLCVQDCGCIQMTDFLSGERRAGISGTVSP
jgi:hypothetical protein